MSLPRFTQKSLNDHAENLVSIHERMADYIGQAPVIVAASVGTIIGPMHRQMIADTCERGPKLRALMGIFGLAYPLRRLRSKAIIAAHAERGSFGPAYRRCGAFWRLYWTVHPSTLAQAIARHTTIEAQRAMLRNHYGWWLAGRGCFYSVGWMVRTLDADFPHDIDHVVDFFFKARQHIDWRWGAVETSAAIRRWGEACHDEDAQLSALKRRGLDPDADLGVPAGWPRERTWRNCEISLHALTTRRALIAEGRSMRHCVATYDGQIAAHRIIVYSVREAGLRIATAEIVAGPPPIVRQIKARFNAPARREAVTAVKALVDDLWGAL